MSKRSLEEDIHKKFLRLQYNMDNLCRRYERLSKEEDASLELNCTTGEVGFEFWYSIHMYLYIPLHWYVNIFFQWVQVVKSGKKPLTESQVKQKLKELDFGRDLVCSSASVGNITDEKVKIRVMKHNKVTLISFFYQRQVSEIRTLLQTNQRTRGGFWSRWKWRSFSVRGWRDRCPKAS